MNQLTLRDLQTHVPVVGWLMIVGHALFIAIGGFVFILLTGVGAVSRDPQAMTILSIVGTLVGMFMFVLAVPGLIAGVGLLKRKSWARLLAIVISLLNLLNFPLGTALALYSLFVLFQTSATEYFEPNPAPPAPAQVSVVP